MCCVCTGVCTHYIYLTDITVAQGVKRSCDLTTDSLDDCPATHDDDVG